MGTPGEALGSPWEALGTPWQALGTPWGEPWKNLGRTSWRDLQESTCGVKSLRSIFLYVLIRGREAPRYNCVVNTYSRSSSSYSGSSNSNPSSSRDILAIFFKLSDSSSSDPSSIFRMTLQDGTGWDRTGRDPRARCRMSRDVMCHGQNRISQQRHGHWTDMDLNT